jgi:hypothetical protein
MRSVIAPVITMPRGAARYRRLAKVIEARRRLGPGRAWINGREVGGTERRYAHLAVTHD